MRSRRTSAIANEGHQWHGCTPNCHDCTSIHFVTDVDLTTIPYQGGFMELSRRTALQGAGALGLGALFATTFQGAAHAVANMDDAELDVLRERWVDLNTGRREADGTDPDFATALADLDEDAQAAIEDLVPEADDRVFANLPIGESEGKDRKSTRLNSSHVAISYAVFCLKKKKKIETVREKVET